MDDDQFPFSQNGDATHELDETLGREPFWTTRRIILTIIILITLIAFLAYSLQGLFLQPPSPPPVTPRLPPMV
jgi:hypothetical protein